MLYYFKIPASITTLLGDTAADNKSPSMSNAPRNSVKRFENPSLSLFGPRLQSTYLKPNRSTVSGYSSNLITVIEFVIHLLLSPANTWDIPSQSPARQNCFPLNIRPHV